jgi:hypothetical protein
LFFCSFHDILLSSFSANLLVGNIGASNSKDLVLFPSFLHLNAHNGNDIKF